jgi:galactose mutarotase-like enzyme
MTDLILQNEQLTVAVAADFGARVTRLIDRASGRDWMAPGGQSSQTGEDAVYGLAEAVGWDECFPTVGRCDATGTVWGGTLRDHGDLWGRPFAVVEHRADLLTLEYVSDLFRFVRTLRLDGATLYVDYHIDNLTAEPMPYLWALHGLLAVRPGERIELPGVTQLTAPYVSLNGAIRDLPVIHWPDTKAALGFDIDIVQPQTAGFAAKMYAAVPRHARARVGRLEIVWSGDQIGHLGLWFTYGGWPGVGGVQQLAIEPTNASAGDLAEGLGQITPIPPLGHHRFAVQFTISQSE